MNSNSRHKLAKILSLSDLLYSWSVRIMMPWGRCTRSDIKCRLAATCGSRHGKRLSEYSF